MQITITFSTDNAAFENDGEIQMVCARAASTAARLLDQHKRHPEYLTSGHSLHDSNGNSVGEVRVASGEV